MTMPYERGWAINNTRDFLFALIDRSKTKRVPKEIRERAYRCLKHYPGKFDIESLQKKCPEILGKLEVKTVEGKKND